MKKLFLSIIILFSLSVNAADYTVEFTPSANSVGNEQVSSLAADKISNFTSAVISAISSTLSSYLKKEEIKLPTMQRFTSGSGQYNLPQNPKPLYIKVRLNGGGGGGAGSHQGGAAGTNATSGGNTIFGSYIARGGSGASSSSNNSFTPGGTITLGSGASVIHQMIGQSGSPGGYQTGTPGAYIPGGNGGSSVMGPGAVAGGYYNAGVDAENNTGGGGGGGGGQALGNYYTGKGGGAGAYLELRVDNPENFYNFTVGAGGPGGSAGGSGVKGGHGGSGIIIVEEFYQ